MELTPADKVIGRIRKHRKDIFLVGFKTTANATPQEQFSKGLALMKKASCNLVMVNDTVTRNNFIITPEEESYNLISDIFAVMPAHMAESYFLYDDYERLHSTPWEPEFLEWLRNIKQYPEQDIQTHIHTRYCPHLMLMRNIIMNGHNYVIDNLPVSILR